uniref:Ig-like domain-containing protein n=1 Tax=Pelusios castaneus TaxID=367368 RepID=A0A8C8RHD8_9SAUR
GRRILISQCHTLILFNTILLFPPVSCCEAQVAQSPELLVIGEGEVSTMSCSFTTAYQVFQWYQQLPGREPTHLLTASSENNVTEGRFTGERLENGKRSSLHITDSQLRDSGSYLCAVDTQ